MRTSIEANRRNMIMSQQSPRNQTLNHRRTRTQFEGIDFKIGSKHRDMTPARLGLAKKYEGPPMIDTKTFKQQFLKGDKGVVMYLDAKGPKTSSYQENLKGMQVTADRRAFILDNQHTSFIQTTVPDPMTMSKLSLFIKPFLFLNSRDW